jgi:hypothetical protein
MADSDDLILKIEVDEDGKTWVVTVYAENGRKIDENEFILEVECWLSELNRAHDLMSDTNTQIH